MATRLPTYSVQPRRTPRVNAAAAAEERNVLQVKFPSLSTYRVERGRLWGMMNVFEMVKVEGGSIKGQVFNNTFSVFA